MQLSDLSALRKRQQDGDYLLPAYEDWCFSRVPGTIADLLGADIGPRLPDAATDGYGDVSRVVVFLVDGFGLAQWDGERERVPFLRRFERAGTVTPLTSVYPSETAAALNTFHSATLPAEHGVIGWNVYDPDADEMFEALPFIRKDGSEPERIDFEDVANAESIYPELSAAGVETHHVTPFPSESTVPHTYDPEDLSTFLDAFAEAAEGATDPSYIFAYLPQTDAIGHAEGVDSDAYRETADETFARVSGAIDMLAETTDDDGETLVCITADHGLIDTDPDRNVDLSAPPFDLVSDLKTLTDGTPIRFAGSPRNVHLHLEPERIDEVHDTLTAELDARVFRKQEVLDSDLFGPNPSATFERRLGDLVVVHQDLGVWFGDEEEAELGLVAMHGGLHPDEMLVPFATATLDSLR
ncbi:alkaline phosphatase family protein [Haloferax mediterranei ATCC 33500]|uniref:Alkaline phosphatase family protein n=1 Tax=Haloferax mediterranei (strain ATCC 33500 / DSM 1411 / JCM 8866 / NBRC 14739 / NCIMB 2177 / R-4) TaxID=523841 RepID=I3R4C4_HALMT|nr:nucleotide pyrophosphatase/phosphodiesterase family protein [Haloferax mediterranei]AFK19084.1 type I phosphodiesterase/nucleotide pyrophosphatase [Haloferax mediterranei ATCC 33500]AHZ21555.1 nucleotide pyrophosphatase [Haloferax mediterranei ATCC 33500]EMA04017.1 type I phosphodiesterase/nucleotide pyrophosphatase [Haloferax mediterranei ATCC 33500]MDX5989177.1 alkaline phosphatase family protein [Haloferax mediterranei ATCC 33500]QCQ75558.1 alkaline phosphatase family protein [Haloferax 